MRPGKLIGFLIWLAAVSGWIAVINDLTPALHAAGTASPAAGSAPPTPPRWVMLPLIYTNDVTAAQKVLNDRIAGGYLVRYVVPTTYAAIHGEMVYLEHP